MSLVAPINIHDPMAYFEQGYTHPEADLGQEMMNNAIQALLLRTPPPLDQALALVERMPPTCVQRDYAISAIALKQIDNVSVALATANRMTQYPYFLDTVNQICRDQTVDELTAVVLEKFPEAPLDEVRLLLSPTPIHSPSL